MFIILLICVSILYKVVLVYIFTYKLGFIRLNLENYISKFKKKHIFEKMSYYWYKKSSDKEVKRVK